VACSLPPRHRRRRAAALGGSSSSRLARALSVARVACVACVARVARVARPALAALALARLSRAHGADARWPPRVDLRGYRPGSSPAARPVAVLATDSNLSMEVSMGCPGRSLRREALGPADSYRATTGTARASATRHGARLALEPEPRAREHRRGALDAREQQARGAAHRIPPGGARTCAGGVSSAAAPRAPPDSGGPAPGPRAAERPRPTVPAARVGARRAAGRRCARGRGR